MLIVVVTSTTLPALSTTQKFEVPWSCAGRPSAVAAPLMKRAIARLVDMLRRQQLVDRHVDVDRVRIQRAIDESLAHHFDQAREVGRRIEAEPGQRARPNIPSISSTTPPDDGGGIV